MNNDDSKFSTKQMVEAVVEETSADDTSTTD